MCVISAACEKDRCDLDSILPFSAEDTIHRQAVVCHRVLRLFHSTPKVFFYLRLKIGSGECKSWPSKVRQWSGKPGTPSSLSCWPSMTPCLRLLLSRMTWEINSVNEFLGCSMRFGSLPVSNPFLGLLSGRHFRYNSIRNTGTVV